MNMRKCLCSALLLVFLVPTLAFAQQDLEKAKEAFGEGKSAYDSEDYATAAAKFVEAYEYSDRPELLYNIGLAYQGAGELPEAEKYFQRYLKELPNARNADEVVNLVIDIQQEIAASYGTLEISANKTAQVFLTGESAAACQTPCSLVLKAGKYDFVARADGSLDTPFSVQLSGGKVEKKDITLNEKAVLGYLALESDRSANILINGESKGQLPLSTPLELAPGNYQVQLNTARDVSWSGDVTVKPDQTLALNVPLEHNVSAAAGSSWKRQASIALGVGAIGFGVGGMFMGMQAQDTFDRLGAQEASRGFVDPDLKASGESQSSTANILYGVAGGVLLGAVGLFVWDFLDSGAEEEIPASEPPPEPATQQGEPAGKVELL